MQLQNMPIQALNGLAQASYDSDLSSITPEAISKMDLAVLIRRCIVESERFYHSQPYDPRLAYELFRRAIVEQNEIAWNGIYQLYAPQVERWVRRYPAFLHCDESGEYFVNAAFARFAKAIPAEKFAKFATLAALLNYLQHCARCVVIDNLRAFTATEALPEEETHASYIAQMSPDEEAIEHMNNVELWYYVDSLLHTELERTVIYLSFVVGMKPRVIHASYPNLFSSVHEVYAIKRNVLERLSRDRELRKRFL
jgi:hypothetical protein